MVSGALQDQGCSGAVRKEREGQHEEVVYRLERILESLDADRGRKVSDKLMVNVL